MLPSNLGLDKALFTSVHASQVWPTLCQTTASGAAHVGSRLPSVAHVVPDDREWRDSAQGAEWAVMSSGGCSCKRALVFLL
jgi:hypothetical protein